MHTAKRSGHWAQASEASMLKCSTQIQQKPWDMQDWLHRIAVHRPRDVNPITSLRVIRREHLTCIGDVRKDLTDVTSSLGWLKRHALDRFESFWSILYTDIIVCSLVWSMQAAFALLNGFHFPEDLLIGWLSGMTWPLSHLCFKPPDLEYGHFVRCTNQIQQRRCEFEQWQSSALQKWCRSNRSSLHFLFCFVVWIRFNAVQFACTVLRGETGGDLKGCIRGLRDEVEDAGDVESWSRKIYGKGHFTVLRWAVCFFRKGNWR